MFRSFICVLLLTGIGCCQQTKLEAPPLPADGEYIALEKMPNISPDDPEARWFHENTLLIRNSQAILDMVPIWIKNHKKVYSASDGGFKTYRGQFFQRNEQTFVNLRLVQSDYIMVPVGTDPYKEITTRPVKLESGDIVIGGVRYCRKALAKAKKKALLQLLENEPLENPPSH